MGIAAERRSESRIPSTELELVITRVFDAPRTLVFQAWMDPERVRHWCAPPGVRYRPLRGRGGAGRKLAVLHARTRQGAVARWGLPPDRRERAHRDDSRLGGGGPPDPGRGFRRRRGAGD